MMPHIHRITVLSSPIQCGGLSGSFDLEGPACAFRFRLPLGAFGIGSGVFACGEEEAPFGSKSCGSNMFDKDEDG